MQYCTLAYCAPQECTHASVDGRNSLLLIMLHENKEVQILVNPDWRTLIQEQDLDFLEELFGSFIKRASEDPLALFEQLTSLSVGPIVTKCAGTKAYSDLLVDPQYCHFVELR